MPDAGDVKRMQAIIARLKTYGVVVREMPGWQNVGLTWARVPVGIIDHHDASSIKSGEWGSLGVIVNGRDGIPAPLAQFQRSRGLDGVPKVAIVAAGRANHAGLGGPLNIGGITLPKDNANAYMYGAEWANDGLGEPMTAAGAYATNALFHSVLEVCG
jgi:hypothetical protein